MKKQVLTVALSGAMVLGIASPAFADTATIPTLNTKLTVNNGSSVTTTFSYTATPVELTVDGVDGEKTYTDGPEVKIADVTLDANNQEATGTGAITFGGKADASAFSHAGVYAWTIKENANTYSGTGAMSYDDQVYTLIASVENGATGFEFGSFYVVKGTATSTNGAAPEDKVSSIDFSDSYTETTTDNNSDNNNSDLSIKKIVTGNQGDKNKAFEFTVTFDASSLKALPAGENATAVLNHIVAEANGATITEQGTATGNTRTFKFTAADAKAVKFSNVLTGITYKVEETATPGYTGTWSAISNGTSTTNTSDILIGENENTGVMTNEHKSITPTGILINNAPFIILGGMAIAGVVVYGGAKKKLEK